MTPHDLKEITGFTRYAKQAGWLRQSFGIEPLRRADGVVIMTWETYRALEGKRAGIMPAANDEPATRAPLRRVTFGAKVTA